MSTRVFHPRLTLFAAIALVPFSQAVAAPCSATGATALTVGAVVDVAPLAARNFSLKLDANDGVIVDLSGLKLAAAPAHSDSDEHKPVTVPHVLKLCDARGVVLAPQPGEVFEKGGSVSTTSDGARLRFVAPGTGEYFVSVDASDEPRELLVRRRSVGASPSPVVSAQLDTEQKGIASSSAPMVFSFAGSAGQWVFLKSTSEKDTLLRLAGPDRTGEYTVISENDDSDGLNPIIRRKLPITGTYYLQVDSLSDDPGEFELQLKRTDAPKPPAPPAALHSGVQVTDKLASGDDVRLYALSVVSGHSYRVDLNAVYDGVVAIGLPNPVEPDDGGDKPDAAFAEIKSQDTGTTGLERLNFTARSTGQLLVRVKCFGIGDTDGTYTLIASDLGG